MNHQLASIEKFHRAFGAPVASEPGIPTPERLALRCKLILEECMEFLEAAGFEVLYGGEHMFHQVETADFQINRKLEDRGGEYVEPSMVGMCDALKDIQVVTLGTEVEMGLQKISEPMFDEVMASNMSKLDENGKPIYREDGKILKGLMYFKPNLKQFLPSTFILGEK